MVYFSEIVKSFNTPPITGETLLINGKTASTYLLHTNTSKKYILKSIGTKEQAYFEYQLIQYFRTKNKKNVSEILTTKSDEPFIQINNTLFQLQVYVPSVNEKAPLQEVLNAYQLLQKYLEDFHYERARHNRFSLDGLWEDTKELLSENYQNIYDQLCPSIEKLKTLDNNPTNWIHGDLGVWNTLYTIDRNVVFIDFSEARKGPQYFDLVAIFASYLPRNIEEIDTYIQDFFLKNEALDNLKEFYQTLELWYVKGILSLLKVDIQSTKEHVLYFSNKIKRIRNLTAKDSFQSGFENF